MHFVKPGVLTAPESHIISTLMKYREEADYNPSYIFTEKDFTGSQQQAESVYQRILKILAKAGFPG